MWETHSKELSQEESLMMAKRASKRLRETRGLVARSLASPNLATALPVGSVLDGTPPPLDNVVM